ncbi:MAG TPA: hypothetical protein VFH97_07820 [Gemmatimonadales bacterium]|nr:hypothetical protein [Gemmatimonadales bacterium]
MTRTHRLLPLALIALLGACDNESLNPPAEDPDLVNALFARYVAFGNSITAGFQSGGINDSTQERAYPVLLAAQMGTGFNVPLLNQPGCPPPFTNVFTQEVVGGPTAPPCALRQADIPDYLNNVAYPGAEVLEAFTYFEPDINPSETDVYRTFLLGGLTSVEAARRVQPTFVSVWLGNNDVLGAILDEANPGDPDLVTNPVAFAAHFSDLMDSLDTFATIQGGVAIGTVHAALAPYLTQGRAWEVFESRYDLATQPLNALDVTNCISFIPIPGTNDTAWASVPFAVGGPALALAQARVDSVLGGDLQPGDMQTVVIDCADDNRTVTAAEVLNMFSAVAQYNAVVEAEADERGWAYLDPNTLLGQLSADTTALRRFPAFPGTAAPNITVNEPFGWALSLDGVHPSSQAHFLVAQALAQAINVTYGTNIPISIP